MPLFGNKFSPKKTPQRKASTAATDHLDELMTDDRVVRFKLGDHDYAFRNGQWLLEKDTHALSSHKLHQKINDLQEENNLLRLKYEILLNMLTQTTAESHLQQREIDKLRKIKNKK